MTSEGNTQYLKVYQDLSEIPRLEGGRMQMEGGNQLLLQYSKQDVRLNKQMKFISFFEKGQSGSYSASSFPISLSDAVIAEVSPSWKYLAVIRRSECPDKKKWIIEIWNNSSIEFTVPIERLHEEVYSDTFFGSLSWSHDEQYVAYVADRARPKTESFFSANFELKENVELGSKFVLREDWGEKCVGGNPSIFVLSIRDKAVCPVNGISDYISTGEVTWSPSDKYLVFTGWNVKPRRLGIIHCYNRPSSLYAIPFEWRPRKTEEMAEEAASEAEKKGLEICLTRNHAVNRFPRFSPDGQLLVYMSSDDTKLHHSCFRLAYLKWVEDELLDGLTEQDVTIKNVTYKIPNIPDVDQEFSLATLQPNIFITDRKVLFSTIIGFQYVPLIIDLSEHTLRHVDLIACNHRSLRVLDVKPYVGALFDGEEIDCPQYTIFFQWDVQYERFSGMPVVLSTLMEKFNSLSSLDLTVKTHLVERPSYSCPTKKGIQPRPSYKVEYMVIYRCSGPEVPSKRPVILFPHGGPHSVSLKTFSVVVCLFAHFGYAVILVNYLGSLGYGQEFINALPGHIGNLDVEDCLAALEDALIKETNVLDGEHLFVIGASHGGFLAGNLISKRKNWRAAVLINSTLNLAQGLGTTDIPDYCFAEIGETDYEKAICGLYACSPISKVKEVVTPTLIIAGAADKRVPMAQSLEYYYALRARGIETKCLVYPGAGHSITEPEHVSDYLINSLLWFEKNRLNRLN